MNRRRFLLGALSAPAVITTPGLLMPVKALVQPVRAIPSMELYRAMHKAARAEIERSFSMGNLLYAEFERRRK